MWLEDKERNVRALLCTLPTVLWDGVRWSQISMSDVMTVKQVKQQYRKAARAVHPDKVSTFPYIVKFHQVTVWSPIKLLYTRGRNLNLVVLL